MTESLKKSFVEIPTEQ